MKYVQLAVLLCVLTMPVSAQPARQGAEISGSGAAPLFWSMVMLVLLVGVGVWLWRTWNRLNRHRGAIESLQNRFNEHLTQVAGQSNEVKKQVEILVGSHAKWESIEKEISALLGRLETLEAAGRESAPPQANTYKKEKRPPTETFYMTFPVGNYFPITAKSETRDNTIYKFRVRPNKTEADFEVHTAGAPMQELIGMVQTYIKPACDEENMPSAQVRTIVTTQAGLAALEGDKWIIKKKALIRYE